MVEIFDAVRYDILSGAVRLHRGTKDYLEKLRATLVEKSGREVPDHYVDTEGRYIKERED